MTRMLYKILHNLHRLDNCLIYEALARHLKTVFPMGLPLASLPGEPLEPLEKERLAEVKAKLVEVQAREILQIQKVIELQFGHNSED
mmetsp:Transcript_9382/g.14290  ORF Transcript_9382/g.14290 Transcript_9382/m.14290 type:complete len:87 (-) Transcript_9382:1759-2019(-)